MIILIFTITIILIGGLFIQGLCLMYNNRLKNNRYNDDLLLHYMSHISITVYVCCVAYFMLLTLTDLYFKYLY